MAIPKFLKDVQIISKLGDFPRSDNNLSPEQFRAKFDEGAQLIKDFLNNDLIPNINAIVDVQALLNSVIDKTLTLQDKAAEAKAVGEALTKKLSLSGGTMTGSIDMGSHAIENIPYPTENAHPATKGYVDNHKIDRDHLADDALYSPLHAITGNYSIVETDLGKTINNNTSSDIVVTLDSGVAGAMPQGAEIAILRGGAGALGISFTGDNLGIGRDGDGYIRSAGSTTVLTVQIPERFGMIALKKIYSNIWVLTGNVEVV